MKKELFKIWTPLDNIPRVLYCEGIHDDYEGFRILLKGEDEKDSTLRLKFSQARAYRKFDEGDILRTIESIDNPGKSSLFLVENSRWLDWFLEDGYKINENMGIKHYAIYTPTDCIDILSEAEPEVEWLN
ncbi:hypothetical protein [Amphritea pacifica]|uniref:YopX protein domain-containing protein n=1 Tax=Amphritea pacifica TaxID=2811233 RepID=A0ABS2W6J8_9GAMM|nr:hypothetical protein [Amphritea pacifica]MBN0987334.1 hypothetical protein [Amphritea pacifica]